MNTPTLSETRPMLQTLDIQIIDVSPDQAQVWLGLNTANRKLKPGTVSAYARDMSEGRWFLNGEAIKFSGPRSNPGKLQDGQNRLHAILKSKTTVRMLVIFNVPAEAQSTMDSGAKRSVADNLTIAGGQHASITASAAGLALRIEDGYLTGHGGQVTNSRSLNFIHENPALIVSAAVASQYAVRADVSKSVVAYTHWRFSRLNLDDATAFWRDAALKIDLPNGDPVLAVTSRFSQARRSRERVVPGAAVAAIFRAWNARRSGQTLKTVALTIPMGELPRLR